MAAEGDKATDAEMLEAAKAIDDAPDSVEVPALDVGRIIGSNGNIIKRLIQSTGCRIEVPGDRPKENAPNAMVTVRLEGGPDQRRVAAAAILDIVSGGDADDHVARQQGGMILTHGFEDFERKSWVAWRLVPTEKEVGVKTDIGRQTVRLWARGRTLTAAEGQRAREEAEAAIAEARLLIELVVDCKLDLEAENAAQEISISPLVDQYGVLIRVNRPENGVVPVKVVGPADAARDAAEILEAKYVKGKATATVLQLPGQVQGMEGNMKQDFQNDVRELEGELKLKVLQRRTVMSIIGSNAESVNNAKKMLRDMLLFYYPADYYLLQGLKHAAIGDLRADEDLRIITTNQECAIAWDRNEGSAWICGPKEPREAAKARIEEFMKKWLSENFEMDLEDYGSAMWLLGPRGTGDYLQRMQAESGARMKVCPINCKVWARGTPLQIKAAEAAVLDALQRLAEKKKLEEEGGVVLKVKPLLAEQPEHMAIILGKLAELNEKARVEKMTRVRKERDASWAAEMAAAANPPALQGGAGGAGGDAARERSPRR